MKKLFLLSIVANLFFASSYAQQNVGLSIDGLPPDNSAMLDVRNPNKGLLIPRVALTGTTDAATISSPATSLLVYNTATNGTGNTAVSPGYYFWSGTAWLMLSTGSGSGSPAATSWLLTGNAGTDTSVNFLGTTDNKPLQFKVNNIRSGYIGALSNDGNVFWGYQSGLKNKGFSNVGLGIKTLFSNTTATNLVAVGDSALFNNSIGALNTAVGSKSLYSNTSGFWNTANGYNALYSNTGGFYNTANGVNALRSNTTGSNNTANGVNALRSNTSGGENTANGVNALQSNTIGAYNTANGLNALQSNTSGGENTANGYQSLASNTSGSGNTATGQGALLSNTVGYSNSANGYNALYSNTTGFFNVGNGPGALYFNTIGISNTASGYNSLQNNTTGNYNTALGYGANVSSGALTNSTALGSGAIVNVSNKVRIGNTFVAVIEGQVAYSFPSDARFKYNIQHNVPGLDFIKKLTPVTYYFDEEKLVEYTKTGVINNSIIKPASYKEKQLHTGFLAQDVEKIATELGYSFDGVHAPANDKDHYSLAYSQFIMPLVKSVQEQQEIINSQAEEIKRMNEKIETLVKAIEVLTHKGE